MTVDEIRAIIQRERERSEEDGIFICEMKQPWDSALSGYYHCLDRLETLLVAGA